MPIQLENVGPDIKQNCRSFVRQIGKKKCLLFCLKKFNKNTNDSSVDRVRK